MMKLLQKYPWLIPDDGKEWVPVEATPIIESAQRSIEDGDVSSMLARAPWPRFAIEFTAPSELRPRICALCMASSDESMVGGWVDAALTEYPDTESETINRVRRTHEIIEMHFYAHVLRRGPKDLGRVTLGVDGDGLYTAMIVEGGGGDSVRDSYVMRWAVAVLSSLAFLNCKNVTVEDEPSPYRKAKVRREKGRGIVYKQLVVNGLPITRRPGRESKEDANRRLHICRGHFADHRENGLFGDPTRKGIYWKPMHVRGSKANGEVIKDYKVCP